MTENIDESMLDEEDGHNIAVIGMACKFPGAENPRTFWQHILNKQETISFFSEAELLKSNIPLQQIRHNNYVPARGTLNHIDQFDAAFFGYSPYEAKCMDPQHRIFLQQAWTALESAGYHPEKFSGLIGVFAGMNDSSYLLNNLLQNKQILEEFDQQQLMLATSSHYLSTKVAYAMGLTGPCITVNTACSSSLVAIALACENLTSYGCDMALAGGIALVVPQQSGYLYRELGILSPDGHCRAFDNNAQGTVMSNGCGIVVLKRMKDALKDNDTIFAVIKGWAINNDGANKAGFTAPSIQGQAACVRETIAHAGIEPTQIEYLEAHGTGTLLGDPIEIAALCKGYQYDKYQQSQYCALGSVKPNIGHTDTASGVASFIKTALALHEKILPPTINYTSANERIDFTHSPFYVNGELKPWESKERKRTAAVNSLGFGGTNAHVILQEAPTLSTTGTKSANVLILSAKTSRSLETMTTHFTDHFSNLQPQDQEKHALANAAYTLQLGRKSFKWRRLISYTDYNSLLQALKDKKQLAINTHETALTPKSRIIFGFPGQGAQYFNMAADIYKEQPFFKQIIDECCDKLKAHTHFDLREILFTSADAQKLQDTRYAQPALFVIEYALSQLLIHCGIKPDAMIGHSVGEYVAATLAGVLTLDSALKLITVRAELMARTAPGMMLVIPLSKEQITPLLTENISLAAHNAPNLCVVSGAIADIEKFKISLQPLLDKHDLFYTSLRTSHAFHSVCMDAILQEFQEAVSAFTLNTPRIPYISNVTGQWLTENELEDASYWVNHLRNTVLFSEGIECLALSPHDFFVEVGPGKTLLQLIRQHQKENKSPGSSLLPSLKHHQDNSYQSFVHALGQLWLFGQEIEWQNLYLNETRQRIPLPTYAFEQISHWVNPNNMNSDKLVAIHHDLDPTLISNQPVKTITKISPEAEEPMFQPNKLDDLGKITSTLANLWCQLLGIATIELDDDFYELGGNSLLAISLIAKIQQVFNLKIPASILFKAKTVRDLAKTIRLQLHAEEQASLVILQEGTRDKPPLFMIHPIGGTVFCYLALAKNLKQDRVIYGLQDPMIEQEKHLFHRLEEMASFYLKIIQEIQPEGPYYLCGSSFGATVVMEMAAQLLEKGQSVHFIGLFDGWATFSQQQMEAGYIKSLRVHYQSDTTSSPQITANFSLWEERIEHRLTLMLTHKIKQLTAPITLFKASDILSEYQEINIDDNHWTPYSTFPLTIYNVPGDHHTMLHNPNAVILADYLERELNKTVSQALA